MYPVRGEGIEVVALGDAENLDAVGMDEIQVADQCQRGALLVGTDQVVDATGSGYPAQAEFLAVVLVKLPDRYARHGCPVRA